MATPTGKLIRNPQVLNAMGTSTIAAPSQQAVTTAVADAKKAGTDAQITANTANSTANAAKTAAATADGKAVAAQNTANSAKITADTAVADAKTAQTAANGAKTAADNAQKTANEAKTAAGAAQTAANNANSNANGRVPSGRKVNNKALTADISLTAADVGALTKSQADSYYQPKGQSGGITLGAVESTQTNQWSGDDFKDFAGKVALLAIPDNCVVTKIEYIKQGARFDFVNKISYRRITGGL